jgi:hypothetical protein
MAPNKIEIVEENGGKANDGNANGNDNGNPTPTRNNSTKANKRSRWATRKMTVRSSNMKRLSIIGRKAKRLSHHSEKKRASGGTESLRRPGGEEADDDADSQSSEEVSEPRTVYFGLPLPDEEKDEEGHPKQKYTRNKIRTAKYTPLSFIPKNLWYQFHNIANIFFLFTVILVVCISNHQNPRCALALNAHGRLLDLPNLQWHQSGSQRSSADCYHLSHRDQGRLRGLPAHGLGQRT